MGTVIFYLLAAGFAFLILYVLIQSAVRDGVGKALRDHDEWRRRQGGEPPAG